MTKWDELEKKARNLRPIPTADLPPYVRLSLSQERGQALVDIDKGAQAIKVGRKYHVGVSLDGHTMGGVTVTVKKASSSEIKGVGCADQSKEDGGSPSVITLCKDGNEWFAHGIIEYGDEEREPCRVIEILGWKNGGYYHPMHLP